MTTTARHSDWTPARWFLAVSGVYHLPMGLLGLLVDQTFPLSADAAAQAGSGFIFGVFETNGWHSVAALGLGVVSLVLAARPRRAREAALTIGLGHVLIVAAFALRDPSTFLFASNGADQIIHSATAIGGTVTGVLTRKEPSGGAVLEPG